jgi:hypothetical protein
MNLLNERDSERKLSATLLRYSVFIIVHLYFQGLWQSVGSNELGATVMRHDPNHPGLLPGIRFFSKLVDTLLDRRCSPRRNFYTVLV